MALFLMGNQETNLNPKENKQKQQNLGLITY